MKLHGAALSAVPLSAKLVQRSRPLENGTLGQTACGLLQRTNRRGRVHQVDPSFLFFSSKPLRNSDQRNCNFAKLGAAARRT